MCQWWMRRHILPVASTRWGKKKKRCWFEDVIPAPFSHRYVVVSWEMNNVKSIYNKWRWCKLLRLVLLRPSKQEVGGMRWRWGNNVVSSKLSVVPAFSFVMDILLFDKWKQIAWCRRLNGRELGSVKPAAERRWSQSLRFFCGRLRPDWSQHKVLVEEKEKGRTGFRQAAVKLGELTMAALFVAADMGWRWGGGGQGGWVIPQRLRSAFLEWLQTEYVTGSQGLTWLCVELRKTNKLHSLRCVWWHRQQCVWKWLFILLKIEAQIRMRCFYIF